MKRYDCGHINWKATLLFWRKEKFVSTSIHITADDEPIFSKDAIIIVSAMTPPTSTDNYWWTTRR